ncbi:MAG: hypothetical protein NZ553_08555 [Caldilinea sp.]|nr:hypothetical protein [Caldilinea sp.]MDW8440507.1 hypothetical protein [Caldilineaceae bacterium]
MSNSHSGGSPSIAAIAAAQSRLGIVAQFQAGVTGIGSLPHTRPEEAIRFIAELCPEAPFWPQLPHRNVNEYMLLQMMTPVLDLLQAKSAARIYVHSGSALQKRLRTAEAAFDMSSAAGFFAFEAGCAAGFFDHARILKGQISGPLTLGRCLFIGDEQTQPLMANPALMDDLTDYLARLAVWQTERLVRFGRPVMIFVDEPALSPALSMPQQLVYLRRVLDAIRGAGAIAGVHCCASGAASALFEVAPDVISFDAYTELESYMAASEMGGFLARGGALALGLIPTLTDPLEVSVEMLFHRWCKATSDIHGCEPSVVVRQAFITASCGLGLLSESAARASFEQAQRLAALLRTEFLMDVPVSWPLSNRWFCHLTDH